MKPVLFVTGHAPPDRVGAFAALHEREGIEVALFGGRSLHGPSTPDAPDKPDAPDRRDAPDGPGTADRPGTADAAGALGAWGESGEPPSVGSRAAPALPPKALPFPHRYVHQRETARLASSGAYRAVVCSTGGRVALPCTWAGARRGGVPLILWASLWAHPRSAPHLLSYIALRRLYRSADAVVTYGPHVSAYVRARGARNVHVAPQSVDNAFWSAPVSAPPSDPAWPGEARVKFMFAGRPDREKGVEALIGAWQRSGLQNEASSAALVLVGVGSNPPWTPPGGAVDPQTMDSRREHAGRLPMQLPRVRPGQMSRTPPRVSGAPPGMSRIAPVPAQRLREMYADADVLVVPSIRTRTFREPWGLVVNEAMNRGLAILASDAVGAVAGGLVRDGHNGLVAPAGDVDALARALARLAADSRLRARLGAAGAIDVGAYTHEAWAGGFSRALATVGLSRTHC
jgi:glycosyltransferase involved in cell wall biosynthesis